MQYMIAIPEFTLVFAAACGLMAMAYALFVICVSMGVRKRYPTSDKPLLPVSVLIPARNEESRIRRCLESLLRLDYPRDLLEIVVIDDASSDETAAVVREFAAKHEHVRLVQQKENERGRAPKKAAITRGIKNSRGGIIFTTDADCMVKPSWIRTMLRYFTDTTGVVFGWVALPESRGLFQRVQSLEYVSWLGLAAGFAGIGRPTMCNANNFAYRRKAFEEVGGYQDIDHVPSGDDELLMQKIRDNTSWQVAFCGDANAINTTEACPGVGSFLNQRARWASKGLVYKRTWLTLCLLVLYSFYLSFWVSAMVTVLDPRAWIIPPILFGIKYLVDMPLTCWSLGKTRRLRLLFYLPLAELFNLFYVPFVATAGTLGFYKWKDTPALKGPFHGH